MTKPETYAQAASRILTERISQFSRLARKTAARATSDGIHDLRVAARRLAAALTVFDFSDLAAFKEASTGIRRAVGAVRDLDVATENARKLVDRLHESEQAECAPFLRTLLSRRRRLLKELKPLLRRRLPAARFVIVGGDDAPLTAEAGLQFAPLLHRARALIPRTTDPDNAEPIHRLRICIKRVRYRLEIFANVLGESVNGWLVSSKSVQDRLGELHDMDVLIGMIEAYWAHLPDRASRGVDSLLQEAWQTRHRMSAELIEWLPQATRYLDEVRAALALLQKREDSGEQRGARG